MTTHRSLLSPSLTAALCALLLLGCPDVPERPASWADEDSWIALSDDGDADEGPDGDGYIPLSIESVFANFDEAEGGERVTITGGGFEPGMIVSFGEVQAGFALALDDERLNVDVPAHPPGLVDITVEREDGERATLTKAFLYRHPFVIAEVTPVEGLISGGQAMTVTGEQFTPQTRILVGGRQLIDQVFVDPSTITGRVPSRRKGWHGSVDVVASDGFEQRTLVDAFRYHDNVEITWMSPNSGGREGGTFLSLYGTGLGADTVVRIGGVVAEMVQSGEGDVLIARTPPGLPGSVDVELSTPRETLTLRDAFAYTATDQDVDYALVSGWPGVASVQGGTQVALTVTGLGAGITVQAVSATINGVAANVLEVRPSEALVVLSVPPGDPGPAEVVLTSPSGELTSSEILRYEIALQVIEFSPGVVAPETPTEIVFSGMGFDQDTEVFIEGEAATVLSVSPLNIRVLTPHASPGRADVLFRSGDKRLRLPGGLACRKLEDPRVLAIATIDGAKAGGRVLRVYGEGFASLSSPPEILIEGEAMPDVEIVDDAELRFHAPAGPVGIVSVDVGELGLMAMSYERFDPTITYGGTWGGPMREALNVTVLDMYTGAPVEGAFVTLWDESDTPYQGLTDEKGEITLSAPQMRAPQMATASKELYTTASVVDFDAKNVTLLLLPLTSAPPSPGGGGLGPEELPNGTLSGEVVALDKFMLPPPGECDPKRESGAIAADSDLCKPCDTDADCVDPGARCITLGEEGARCTTACSTEDDCPEDFMCTSVGGGAVQCVPRPGDKGIWCGTTIEDVFQRDLTEFGGFSADPSTYTFEASPGEHAVVCLGGFTNPDTGVFKPVLMGVRRHVFAMPGDFVGQQDLVLDIPLNRTLRMRLDDPPMGPGEMNQHQLDVFLDLGPDGVFPMPQRVIGEDLDQIIELPGFPAAFEESLYDASYTIYASATFPEIGDIPSSSGSYTLHKDITAVHDDAVFEIFEQGARMTSTGIDHNVRAMDGDGENWAWAVGDEGKILAYNGTWWGLQQAPIDEDLHGVYVRSTVDVWALGDRGTVVHWDGLTWQAITPPEELATANWSAIAGHEDGTLWLTGDQGVYSIRDEVWSEVDVGAGVPKGALTAIWVAGPDEVWFVGKGGLIRQVLDGQAKALDIPGDDLYAIDGGAEEVWAVGADGRIVRYHNDVWFDYLPLTQRDLHAVHAPDAQTAWVTGDAGTVLRWDGERWDTHTQVEHVDLRGVYRTADGRVLAGGMHMLVIGPFLRTPQPVNPQESLTLRDLVDLTNLGGLGGLSDMTLEWFIEESHPASFTYLQLTEMQGFPFWILMVEGERNTVPLPDLMAMRGLMPLWPGPGFMRFVRVYKPDFDMNDYDNSVLSPFYWRSWATHDISVFW